jgi:hypothetical protein
MRTTIILCLLTLLTALTACSGVPTIGVKDPRCTWNQHCVYTDAPSAIRTEVLRPSWEEYVRDSRLVYKDPAVR